MRLIVTGGGTGGHISPALAIADAVKEKDKTAEILFVGTERGMESVLVPRHGYRIEYVDVIGLHRSLDPENLKAAYKALTAVGKAEKIIRSFRPDAVVGTGGYVCYPMIRAAAKEGVFTALHESNAYPGLAVRMLKNKVDRIYVNFPESERFFGNKAKILRTGNPLPGGTLTADREETRRKLGITGKYRYLILSFGGSLGAEAVNRAILGLMKEFSSKRSDVLHVHGCGKSGYAAFMAEFKAAGLDSHRNLLPLEFIYDMPEYMSAADVVISRAGAMTLSEIAGAGRASVLIPSPNVTEDHQYKNAKAFSDAGAAFTLRENAEELANLRTLTETLLEDENVRKNMEKNAEKFALYSACDVISDELLSFAGTNLREFRAKKR